MSKNLQTPFKAIGFVFKSSPKFFLFAIFFTFTGRTLATIWPYVLRECVNLLSIENFQDYSRLKFLLGGFLFLYFLSEISLRSAAYILINPLAQAIKNLRVHLFTHIMGHSVSFITSRMSGKVSAEVEQVCNSTEQLIDSFYWIYFSTFSNLLMAFFLFLKVHWTMGGVLLLWLILYLPFLRYIVFRGVRHWNYAANQESNISGKIIDTISNFLSVKTFSNKQREKADLEKSIDVSLVQIKKASYFSVHSYSFQETATFILGILSVSWVYYLYKSGVTSSGSIAMVIALFMVLKEKLHSLASRSREFFKQYGKLKNGLQNIFVPHEIEDKKNAQDFFSPTVNIFFKKVFFSYKNGKQVFKDISFKINAGEKIGILGESGAGKTTLINLLFRFCDIDSGSISFNGIDIKEIKQESVRDCISVIPQEPILFHKTIWENIKFANPKVTDQEILEAAEQAQCHVFIEQMPQKYQTIVGERGLKLSGGQKQRIAIARAILKKSPIIILDEATSALDLENEKIILDTLLSTCKDKTIIMISHRQSSMKLMDRLLTIKEQNVKEVAHYKKTQEVVFN